MIGNPFADDAEVGSRYTEAVVGQPSKINPLFAYQNEADRDVASLVFSGLTRLATDGTPQPDLASSWDIEDDGLSVTFHLRPGVQWHTGADFTSEDVVFTYGLLANPAVQADPEQTALWQSINCEAEDNLTVICQLPEPYAPFLAFASVGILPSHILGNAAPETIANDPFNTAPIGTGPYRVSDVRDDHIVLHSNESFYFGQPHIDQIDLLFYPNIATATAYLVRGDADGLLVDLSITQEDFATLREVDGLRAYAANRSAYTGLFINNTEPPLNDVDVRRAVSEAVDIDSIITGLVGGRGDRVDTPIVPGTWAFDQDLPSPSHDLGRARDLLESAGWDLEDGADVRIKNGNELRVTLMTDEDALRGAIADEIAVQLTDIGMEVTVVRQASSDLVNDYLIPRQYQAAVFGWDTGADPDPYPAWHSSQTLQGGRNIAGYTSDDADALMEEARRTSDQADRAELYYEYQGLFLNDVPSVPLYSPLFFYMVRERVQGIDLGVLFTPASRFRNVWEWSLDNSPSIGD
jgi:peptide/nickel transport system substrate-binding protein